MGNAESQRSNTGKPTKLVLAAKALSAQEKQKPKGSVSFEDEAVVVELRLDKIDWSARAVDPPDYSFPFENLVFENGGLKSLAFCGALEYLELVGCLDNIKRFAGVGYGALVALLAAVDFSWQDISTMLGQDIQAITKGGIFGSISFLPNALRGYGATSFGEDIYEKLGKWLKEKCGNPDITFQEIEDKYKKELCVVVTNVNIMCTEYFHPKTTPYLSVRIAVQMSLTIPGVFSPRTESISGSEASCYVDGGLLCNYPVHCFDGWFLSNKQEHAFPKMLYPLNTSAIDKKQEFRQLNENTLGFTVYSNDEVDFMRSKLESRMGVLIPTRPSVETELYKRRQEISLKKAELEKTYIKICTAVDTFYKILEKNQLNTLEVLDKKDLKDAFQDETVFTPEDIESVFGKKINIGMMFEKLDLEGNGMVSATQLKAKVDHHARNIGIKLRDMDRKGITNFVTYMSSLHTMISRATRLDYMEPRDIERTVGINTGHILTEDTNIHSADKQFLIDRGYNSTRAFLQYYVAKSKCPKKHTTIMQKIVEELR